MTAKYRIVIAEDHTILREGLRALIASDERFEVVGEAEDGWAAVKAAESLKPDAILMDLSMPRMSGTDAIREIKRACPDTRILVLTVHKSEEYVLATFQAGAQGYLLKEATHAELMLALRTVLSGKPYLSPGISQIVLGGFLESKKTLKVESAWDSLTQREREILKLVAEGGKNREIADLLCISVKTAEKHRANLMRKLDLHNAAALTAFALEKGLIEGPR